VADEVRVRTEVCVADTDATEAERDGVVVPPGEGDVVVVLVHLDRAPVRAFLSEAPHA
jgi:hypothetical protein